MTEVQTVDTTTPTIQTGEFKFPTFHGKGGEFFKIWIVNVLLTMLTMGIYSAWAKVRTLKYMYGATELEGARFGFHGDPVAILKGRILASIIGFLYIAGSSLSVFVSLLGVALIYFLFPFLMVKSLKFRLGNTSYRNLRFAYRGTVEGAYKIWFKYTVPFLAFMVCNVFIVRYLEGLKTNPDQTAALIGSGVFFAMLIMVFIYSLYILPKLYNEGINYIYNSAYYAGNKFHINSSLSDFKSKVFWPLTIKYILMIVAFVVSIMVLGFLSKSGSPEATEGAKELAMLKVMGVPLFLFYVGLFCFAIYSAYLVKDYIWNRITLAPNHPTKSKLNYLEYLKISFVNVIGMIFTFGFFFPWAKMRSKKYLVEQRGIQIDDLDKFASDAEENISALGEEAVDAFDFDIEIGL